MGLPSVTKTVKKITVREAPIPRSSWPASQDDVRTGPDAPRYPDGIGAKAKRKVKQRR